MAPKKKVDSDDEVEEVLSEDEGEEANSADEVEEEEEDEDEDANSGDEEDEEEEEDEDDDIKVVGPLSGLSFKLPTSSLGGGGTSKTSSLLSSVKSPVKLNISSGTDVKSGAAQVPSLLALSQSAAAPPLAVIPSVPTPTMTLGPLKPTLTSSGISAATGLSSQPISIAEQLIKAVDIKKPEPYSNDLNVLLVRESGEADNVFNARKQIAEAIVKIKSTNFEPYIAVAISKLYTNIAFSGVKYPPDVNVLLSQVTQLMEQNK
jgi:hypothetical protein